jgi:GNAT superfamily N-acetyltransferase
VPAMAHDEVNDINTAVARRWHGLDSLLPEPGDLAKGCMAPLVATGENGRAAGLGVCIHQHVPDDALAQTWGAATKFTLDLRLHEPDTQATDVLLTQWREHLHGLPQAGTEDTAAVILWPTRDVGGVRPLLRHGLQPMAVIAGRPKGRPTPAEGVGTAPDLVIRQAGPDDVDLVTELEMAVVMYDAHFGGSIPRPATEALVRAEARAALRYVPTWIWIAERDGQPVGVTIVEPPEDAAWIAGMTRSDSAAYLRIGFVSPDKRGDGIGAKLIKHVHDELDARGVDVTLLHYAQVNPLSGPFWSRMGYRPLWTSWEARPAAALR